jgi:hypothetical protein
VRGIDHPTSLSPEAEEREELYICSPSGSSWSVLSRTSPFTFLLKCIFNPRKDGRKRINVTEIDILRQSARISKLGRKTNEYIRGKNGRARYDIG